jgi:hypothetical protein
VDNVFPRKRLAGARPRLRRPYVRTGFLAVRSTDGSRCVGARRTKQVPAEPEAEKDYEMSALEQRRGLTRRGLLSFAAGAAAAAALSGCNTSRRDRQATEPSAPVSATLAKLEPRPNDAVAGVVEAFQTRPIVAIGETHGNLELHHFLIRLVTDVRLRSVARTVALEVSSSAQEAIDRYLADELTDSQLLTALRDAIFSETGAADPKELDLYRAIRDTNRGLPESDRIRVLAVDAPLSWHLACSLVRRLPALPRVPPPGWRAVCSN